MALLLGATATFMALGWIKNQSRLQVEQAPKKPMAPVVVAAKDVDAAQGLQTGQLSVVQWPQESCPKGGFSSVEEVVGRVTVLPMSAGEPILAAKLAPQGTPAGMVALVSEKKRAMTVKVNEASGVAGFIIPNNRVDVVMSINRGEFSNDPLAKVVLENLRVLGTGQKIIEKEPDGKPQIVPTVTLEVTPEEGERLALAASEGTISLVLRSQNDEDLVATTGVKTTQMFRNMLPAEPKVDPAAAKVGGGAYVQVIRMQKVENVNSLDDHAKPAPAKPASGKM